MSNAPSPTERDNPAQPSSVPPTPGYRAPLHRSISHSSWTAEPPHHNQGTSYFPSSPAPRRAPTRSLSAARSLSVSSERDEDENDDDDAGATEGRGKASSVIGVPSPGEQEDEDEDERRRRQYTEDDPLTLKDRQSIMNVDHPFGLPIWKPF